MTSANVTEFRIFRDGKEVGSHSQHCMCKTRWEELLKFTPPEDHEIQPWGYDEEEELWEDERVNLFDFLLLKARPCPFKGIPRALHCIITQDKEGEWSVFGGFVDDHETLSKVAASRFEPGTWKILTTFTAMRHFPSWGKKKDQNHVQEKEPKDERSEPVAVILQVEEPAQGDLQGGADQQQ